jgi:hypothetical protein
MSNIDFQNGFISGMSTRGLTRSGEYYKPRIWNDSGIYDYFYIDFKGQLNDFSLGMFLESIIVYDSEQIIVTDINFISSGVYKVFADIEGKINGVTVINKKSTLLTFTSGRILPVFSTIFYVEGVTPYVRKAYIYEKVNIGISNIINTDDRYDVEFTGYFTNFEVQESVLLDNNNILTTSEIVDVSYWGT